MVDNQLEDSFKAILNLYRSTTERFAENLADLVGTNVVFTGDDPFVASELAEFLPEYPLIGRFVENRPPDPHSISTLVVGQSGFNTALINSCIASNPEAIAILPQEGFIDLVLFGHDWWSEGGAWLDKTCDYHAGLQYVKSLSWFAWPGIDVPESTQISDASDEFATETPLHAMGYWVGGSPRLLSTVERWNVLAKAVGVLGLQAVAETIASHVRVRKAQSGGRERYSKAISKWESDLQRLRKTYFDGRQAGFRWPPV